MASYVKTLKEDNGDITYPQTLSSAAILSGGTDLETELTNYVTAEDIATTSALTPPVQTAMIADGAVTTAKVADDAVTTAKIADGTITAAKIDWSTIFERRILTVTMDSTGNAGLDIDTNNYWILAVFQIGTGAYVNGNAVPYSWSSGKYFIHVDQNYGHAYSTSSITVEVLLLKRSVIGF